nr:hypothetical protein BaRGS_004553 [Batillaria attramentaria]
MGSSKAVALSVGSVANSKAMVDSYLSFNSVGIISPRIVEDEVQDIEGEDAEDPFKDSFPGNTAIHSPLTHTKGPAPVHPGSVTTKNKPPLQVSFI